MAKHHIVQDKYLAQWKKDGTKNHLNIFVIPEGRHKESHTKWSGFWRKDFNVLKGEVDTSYVPEDITAVIDTKGLEAIRKIDSIKQTELSGEDRSAISFYTALQYIRTPRHREESNKMIEANIQHFMRKDTHSLEDVRMSKKQILEHKPTNQQEEKALRQISEMSEDEVKAKIFESVHSEDIHIRLNNTGHSKSILKVSHQAKELFEFQWTFLIAPSGTCFITSDNPCFATSPTKLMNGLLSPKSTVFFPLRPDVCIFIKPNLKSKTELFFNLSKGQVRDINKLIVSNSYECLVAKDKSHLESLLKDFNPQTHKKSRDVAVSENDDYVMFNME